MTNGDDDVDVDVNADDCNLIEVFNDDDEDENENVDLGSLFESTEREVKETLCYRLYNL